MKYDKTPSVISDRLQCILPFANKVVDEIVCEETDLVEKVIPRMFEVMQRVASFSCGYVKHSRVVMFDLTNVDNPPCQRERSVGWST
jgi:hypothetical protein